MGQANTSVWITGDTHHTGPHVGMAPGVYKMLSHLSSGGWVGVGCCLDTPGAQGWSMAASAFPFHFKNFGHKFYAGQLDQTLANLISVVTYSY